VYERHELLIGGRVPEVLKGEKFMIVATTQRRCEARAEAIQCRVGVGEFQKFLLNLTVCTAELRHTVRFWGNNKNLEQISLLSLRSVAQFLNE
jgi:hypothetical protein